MSEAIKIWLLAMIDAEIKEVTETISNNRLWLKGSDTAEEAMMYEENLAELIDYGNILLNMREQIEKGVLPYDL